MARTTDSRSALIELKAVDGSYPLYGTVTLEPTCRSPTRWRSAAARSAPRSIRRCWRGSTLPPARA